MYTSVQYVNFYFTPRASKFRVPHAVEVVSFRRKCGRHDLFHMIHCFFFWKEETQIYKAQLNTVKFNSKQHTSDKSNIKINK